MTIFNNKYTKILLKIKRDNMSKKIDFNKYYIEILNQLENSTLEDKEKSKKALLVSELRKRELLGLLEKYDIKTIINLTEYQIVCLKALIENHDNFVKSVK